MRIQPRVVRRPAPHAGWRALAATALVVPGATAAHTWADGTLPTAPGLLLLTAVVLGASFAVFSWSLPRSVLLAAVAVAQFGMHESFGLVAQHAHHAATVTDTGWTWQMACAHAAVAGATALVWGLGHRAATLLIFLPRLIAARSSLLRRWGRGVVRRPHTLLLLTGLPRRGPPRVVVPLT